MLMECFSLAIWNRNKWIVAMVAIICVTNIALLLLSEFSLYFRHVRQRNMLDISCCSGK